MPSNGLVLNAWEVADLPLGRTHVTDVTERKAEKPVSTLVPHSGAHAGILCTSNKTSTSSQGKSGDLSLSALSPWGPVGLSTPGV